MTETKRIGNRGETIAAEYLKKSGYKITALNYRSGRREIDIIAAKNTRPTFFEVKTRVKNEAEKDTVPISAKQIKNLKAAIVEYCLENRISLEKARLDLITILIDPANGLASLRHYRDIF